MQKIKIICMGIVLSLIGMVNPSYSNYDRLLPETKRQIDCLSDNVYFEANNESIEGKKAVAFVTMNRTKSGKFPSTICDVVKQKNITACQFSWWCNISPRERYIRRKTDEEGYAQAKAVAIHIYFNYYRMHDITKGALFFHRKDVRPVWRHNLQITTRIGKHIFYREVKNG